jgi:1-acyl-sn-glycerol-3-phosphate acyltransferase
MALQAGVPVVPVTIKGGHAILPKGRLAIRPGVIDVHYGAPVETSDFSYDTRDRLVETVRAAIAGELKRA